MPVEDEYTRMIVLERDAMTYGGGGAGVEQVDGACGVQVGLEVWGVLGFSLLVDGYVFMKALKGVTASKPEGVSTWEHIKKARTEHSLRRGSCLIPAVLHWLARFVCLASACCETVGGLAKADPLPWLGRFVLIDCRVILA